MTATELIDFVFKYIIPFLSFLILVIFPFAYRFMKKDIRFTLDNDLNKFSEKWDEKFGHVNTEMMRVELEVLDRINKVEAIVDAEKEKTQGVLKKLETMEQRIHDRMDKIMERIMEIRGDK